MTAAIRPLDEADILAVTSLLTDAFVVDDGMRAIFHGRSEDTYRKHLAMWFLATLQLQLATQQPAWALCIDDHVVGVALLTKGYESFAPRSWLHWLLAVGMGCGWDVVWRTAQHDRQRGRYKPAQPHAVLEFIAVKAEQRGQGYATMLLDAATQWSKAEPCVAGIWLETTRPHNVPFFEHFGYVLTGRMPLEYGEAFFLFKAQD